MTDSKRGQFILLQLLTIARLPISIAFAVVLLNVDRTTPVVATLFVLLLLGEITDGLDGWVARRLNLVSEWGAMLDPYADSVSRLIIYWALGAAGLGLTIVPLVMAIRDVTTAYCRIVWTRRGGSVSARISGKIKAVVQCVAAFVMLVIPFAWPEYDKLTVLTVSWIVIVTTALSGIDYAAVTIKGLIADRDSQD
ncbi:MAG: hypothetical protein CMJ78_08895 [Planctomycetaceae bacterium]|nr:hypothetical protein [Planctomycetaceae bacterium]